MLTISSVAATNVFSAVRECLPYLRISPNGNKLKPWRVFCAARQLEPKIPSPSHPCVHKPVFSASCSRRSWYKGSTSGERRKLGKKLQCMKFSGVYRMYAIIELIHSSSLGVLQCRWRDTYCSRTRGLFWFIGGIFMDASIVLVGFGALVCAPHTLDSAVQDSYWKESSTVQLEALLTTDMSQETAQTNYTS